MRYNFDAKFEPKMWTLQWDAVYSNPSLIKNHVCNEIGM